MLIHTNITVDTLTFVFYPSLCTFNFQIGSHVIGIIYHLIQDGYAIE